MDGRDSKEKAKLTLSLNKDVIQRAKAAGVNISEITEKLLTVVTLTPSGSSYDDVVKAYIAFYEVIKDILRRYAATVTVDSFEDENRNVLLYAGGFEDEIINLEKKERRRIPVEDWRAVRILDTLLENPVDFFDKLIEALIKAAEKNQEKIAKLQFALKLVKTLSEGEKGDEKN